MSTGELRTDAIATGVAPALVAPVVAPTSHFRLHRISVDRYHRMIEAGIIGEKEPIFLWKGQLVEKMTKGHRHNNSQTELTTTLIRLVPAGWHVRVEQSAVLGDDTEPEPDVMVVRGTTRDYVVRLPSAGDMALVIEIADSSLAADAGEVLEKYAQEGIPCYWLVDIPLQRIVVHTQPEGARYAEHREYGSGELVPVVLDGREVGRIVVADVLF